MEGNSSCTSGRSYYATAAAMEAGRSCCSDLRLAAAAALSSSGCSPLTPPPAPLDSPAPRNPTASPAGAANTEAALNPSSSSRLVRIRQAVASGFRTASRLGDRITATKFRIVHTWGDLFSSYAGFVFDHAKTVVVLSFLISVCLGVGFYFRQTEFQMYKLYSLPDTPSQRTKGELLDTFVPERITFISVTSPQDSLTKATLLQLRELNERIENITVSKSEVTTDEFGNSINTQGLLKDWWDGLPSEVSYEDICVRNALGQCNNPSVLSVYYSDLLLGRPIVCKEFPNVVNIRTKQAYRVDSLLGNMTIETRLQGDEEVSLIKNATAFALRHDFTGADGWVNFSAAFEKKLVDVVKNFTIPGMTISVKTERSINDELNRASRMDVPDKIRLFIAVSLVVIYSVLGNSSCNYRNKTWVSLMGVLAALLGYVGGTGLVHLAGLHHTPPAEATPFLVIGIGVDDVFVMLNSYSLTYLAKSSRERVCIAVKDAGISITITTITNIIAFIIGAVSPYYSVSRFCIITAVSLLMGYIMCLTFFLGWLCLDARREEREASCCFSVGPLRPCWGTNRAPSSAKRKAAITDTQSDYAMETLPKIGDHGSSVTTESTAFEDALGILSTPEVGPAASLDRADSGSSNIVPSASSSGVSRMSAQSTLSTTIDYRIPRRVDHRCTYEIVAKQLQRVEKLQTKETELRLFRSATITGCCVVSTSSCDSGIDELLPNNTPFSASSCCHPKTKWDGIGSPAGRSHVIGLVKGFGDKFELPRKLAFPQAKQGRNYLTATRSLDCKLFFAPPPADAQGDGSAFQEKLTSLDYYRDDEGNIMTTTTRIGEESGSEGADKEGADIEASNAGSTTMDIAVATQAAAVRGGSAKQRDTEDDAMDGFPIWTEDSYLDEPKGNVGRVFRRFFLLMYGRWLTYRWVKAVVILCFALYVAGAIWGLKQLKSGLSLRDVTPDRSYLREFYDDRDMYFTSYGEEIVVFFPHREGWWKKDVQDQLLKVRNEINESKYCVFMVEAMSLFLEDRQSKLGDESERTFVTELTHWLEKDTIGKRFRSHFQIEDGHLKAWKFYYWMPFVDNTRISYYWLQDVRDMLTQSNDYFRGLAFTPLSVMWESDPRILEYTLTNMGIALAAIVLVSTLLVPDLLSAVLVVAMIVMVDLGLFGYMTYWNLELNMLTMVNLLISIGFSVDYTAHMVHTFTHCVGETREHRIIETLVIMGNPVTHGMISTLLAVLVLAAADKYALVVFFQMMTMVLLFAFAHGVILLPVILSIIGPMPQQRRKLEKRDRNPSG